MGMYLPELLLGYKVINKVPKIWIQDIAYHPSEIRNDSTAFFHFEAFLTYHDWKNRIGEAIKKGAKVLVLDASDPFYEYQEIIETFHREVNIVAVVSLHNNISFIASKFFGYPQKKLRIIAVTGTNGKTSVTHITAQALNFLGIRAAIISSIGYGTISEPLITEPLTGFRIGYTTPPAISLYKILAHFVEQKVKVVVLEATSHALEWDTLSALDIEIAVFTNITDDHLEYHGNMLSYINAKKKLFNPKNFPSVASYVINADDRIGRTIIRELSQDGKKIFSYSSNTTYQEQGSKSIIAQNIILDISGTSFNIGYNDIYTKFVTEFVGSFYIYNILASVGCLLAMNFSITEIASVFSMLTRIPGRMNIFSKHNKPTTIVDFAHNPDGIEKCLNSISNIAGASTISIVCGTTDVMPEDINKALAKIIGKYADVIYVTILNAYNKDPKDIIDHFASLFPNNKVVYKVYDRKDAIRQAILSAKNDKVIVIIGKGTQNYILNRQELLPHNDLEYVKSIYETIDNMSSAQDTGGCATVQESVRTIV